MTEQRAIDDSKKGSQIAQKHLFDAYADNMLMLCVRYVKNLPDAEELMLNGFFKFFANIGNFVYNGPGSIGAWMKKIMVNECLMFLRRKQYLIIPAEEYATHLPAGDDQLANINAAALLKLITELPPGYRTVFNMYAIEGYTHKEIAEVLGISEGTSKSQLSKARAMLQKELKKTGCYDEQ